VAEALKLARSRGSERNRFNFGCEGADSLCWEVLRRPVLCPVAALGWRNVQSRSPVPVNDRPAFCRIVASPAGTICREHGRHVPGVRTNRLKGNQNDQAVFMLLLDAKTKVGCTSMGGDSSEFRSADAGVVLILEDDADRVARFRQVLLSWMLVCG